jgi:RNA 3'-terminal phosphate cyclase-like protein
MSTTVSQEFIFGGSQFFKQRIVCSVLSGKTIQINDIRSMDEEPGLKDYESCLLRLVEKVSNGCKIVIDDTGTSLLFQPGFLVGGKIAHDCGNSRSIGYFLEALILMAPFGKEPLSATLTGITNHNDNLDISVDLFRVVTLPLLKMFGIENGLEFKITKRGCNPLGGGLVELRCPIVNKINTVQLLDEGKIRRIRGIAFTARITAQFSNRMIDTAKGILLEYIGDVYVYSDHYKREDAGGSPGYGLSLVAETTTGCLLSSEIMGSGGILPEDIAIEATQQLLHEILRGGCCDTPNQSMMLLFMALSSEDLSKIRIGKLTPYTIEYLRNILKFFKVKFNIEPDPESKTVLLSCIGSGFLNYSRQLI